MLPRLSHVMNIPMGYLVRYFRFGADFPTKSRRLYKNMVELLNLVPKQTVLVLNLVLLAIAARVMTWIDTKISRSRVSVETNVIRLRGFGIRHIGSGHNKWICGSESVGHRSHTYIHTYYRIFEETL
jgi:hypothetical protein